MTGQPLHLTRRGRAALYAAIVGGGTVAAVALSGIAFDLVRAAWTF
ncbi:hypothetical protein [Microbacterium maritypicum]